ncbi:hypothetical protein VTI74DRAFT_5792 [Chaetomium olivicolor]
MKFTPLLLALVTAVAAIPAPENHAPAPPADDNAAVTTTTTTDTTEQGGNISIMATKKWQAKGGCKTDWAGRCNAQCRGEAQQKGYKCKDVDSDITSSGPQYPLELKRDICPRAFYNNADEDTKDWLAERLYYRELESIRRDAPLLDPAEYQVAQLELFDRDNAPPTTVTTIAKAAQLGLSRSSTTRKRLPLFLKRKKSILGSPRTLARAAQAVDLTGDDDDNGTQTQAPGPLAGTLLDFAKIRARVGYRQGFEQEFGSEIDAARADFLTAGSYDRYTDNETIFQAPDWKQYLDYPESRKGILLVKGFPMVEDVVFIMHPNTWTRLPKHNKFIYDGHCYFVSLALIFYGDASFWLRVKAEHLCFLEKVLKNHNHPRHSFYSRENQVRSKTKATGGGPEWEGMANMWEMLQIPGCWNNEDMCHLTADVYGVFLVLYKYGGRSDQRWHNKVYDMKAYGAYNSRHIFLCYTHENHFQPMVPNDYYAYEFKLPRLTLRSTKKYRLVTRERRRFVGDGPRHHWRGHENTIPPSLGGPCFEYEHLRRAAGYGPFVSQSAPPNNHASSLAVLADEVPPGVIDLTNPEMSSKDKEKAPAKPDQQAARQALNVLNAYFDNGLPPRQPLPTSRPPPSTAAPPSVTVTPSTPSRKRPADDQPLCSTSSKHPRTNPPSSATTSASSTHAQPIGSFSPINPRPKPSPRSADRSSHFADEAFSSSSASPDAATFMPGGSSTPAGTFREATSLGEVETFYRVATKTLLNKIKLQRLKRWCLDLDVVPGADVMGWKKVKCVSELVRAGVEIRMYREKGGSVVVGEDEEVDRGVVVCRAPVGKEEEEDGRKEILDIARDGGLGKKAKGNGGGEDGMSNRHTIEGDEEEGKDEEEEVDGEEEDDGEEEYVEGEEEEDDDDGDDKGDYEEEEETGDEEKWSMAVEERRRVIMRKRRTETERMAKMGGTKRTGRERRRRIRVSD